MFSKERLESYFREMVVIDSPSLEEREMADYLFKKLKDLGLEVKEDDAGLKNNGQAGNIIGYLPGRGIDKPTILLSAHMDRVEPGRGIKLILKDGVFYSEGDTILAADDLSGVAAILEALTVLKETDISHCPIKVVFTIAEEIGLLGAKSLAEEELNVDFGYAYDCTGPVGTAIIEAPTQNEIKIVVKGKASHAGVSPEEGINAIKVASEAIANIDLGRIDKETTANIGLIQGGQATNIVPAKVVLEGEVRSRSNEKLEQYTKFMEKTFKDTAEKYKTEVEFVSKNAYPLYTLAKDEPVVQRCQKAIEAMGLECKLLPTGGGSDANVFNGKGLPMVNLATGMEKAHSIDEYLPMAELENLVALTLKLITI